MCALPILAAALLLLLVPAQRAQAVQFGTLTDLVTGIGFTTVLTLGPEDPDPGSNADGCVYGVNGGDGTVHRVCFDSSKSVTSNTVVVDLNGGGGINNALGITIDPDSDPADEIHLYIGYSPDNNAPFQGRIARAVSTDGGASYTTDETFITGLGRSSFDHQTNGLDFGPDDCLYISQGNNSNHGYDVDHAESRLSSGILRACFKSATGAVDPAFDRGCGGGNSQQACDVEVYASGLRNPYDIAWHSNGRLYNSDNDGHQGFRNTCGSHANDFGCICGTVPVDPIGDEINLIEQGMYYGSPNPYRAMPSGLQCQGGSDGGDACNNDGDCGGGGTCEDLSALCTDGVCGDIVQCRYFGEGAPAPTPAQDPNGIYRTPIAQISALLDGMSEYRGRFDGRTSTSFCSDWNGDLLVTGGAGSVRRFSLSADGTGATHQGTGNLNGASGLDVIVGPDGTVYTADLNNGKITYLQPQTQSNPLAADYFVQSCASGEVCTAGACETDSDNDSLGDSIDPCVSDPLNRCAGPVVVDGNTGNPIRINASTGAGTCAGTKVDCNGDTWYADFGYNQSASSFECNLAGGCPVDTTAVFGCSDTNTGDLFRCEHYDLPDFPELEYDFDVPDGDYLVNLLFMNAFTGTANVGDRLFDVLIENGTVYAGLDQVEAAGGSGIPVVRAALVTVSDGNGLQIKFGHQLPENPNIKGIEVLGVNVPTECTVNGDCDDSDVCTDDTCNAGFCSNTPNTASCDDGVACTSGDVCSAGVCSGASICSGGDICNAGTGLCETPNLAIRININGAQHTGTDFPGTWSADPGAGGVCGPSAYTNSNPINGTVDDPLFQGEAWGNPAVCAIDDGGSALPAGDYTVNLLFAEIYQGPGCPGGGSGTGARVFDVALEGVTVETGIDIFSEVGCGASTSDPTTGVIMRSYPDVNVVDGVLDISLPSSADNGKISAIEVLLQSGGGGGCQNDGECDDSDLCTTDVCNAGTCENTFDPLVCVDTFPAGDDFEVDFGSWADAGGDDFDWTRNSGGTPSNNTGPSGDHTTGSGSYLYTEASNPNNPSMTALLEGSCIELTGMAQASLNFWYHMYGSGMGTLSVDAAADCGTTWTEDLWTLSGDQGDQWFEANVDLTAYVGSRVRLRFEGLTGSSFASDIAIDDVAIDATATPPSTVPTDIQLPGTQPGELANDVEEAGNCSLCHSNYSGGDPMEEPQHGWGGSMMAHASRDPLFWGAMAVAEKDFAGSGDLCLRCHVPKGWLAGRSEPTDGSALLDSDADGVQCDLCHRLTNPDATEHLGVQNAPFVANDGGAPANAFVGGGMYVLWDQASKLGPYSDAAAPHAWQQSNLHREDEACGTCHDVSNPLTGDLAHNNGAQIPLAPGQYSDTLGGPVTDKAAFLNFPHEYGVVERTFSEHQVGLLSQTPISDFNTLPADLQAGSIQAAYDAAILAGQGGDYADGTPRTFSCQSCHMRATAGEGCSQSPGVRNDLPTHDLTGGNYWVPDAIEYLDGLGQLRLGGGLGATELARLDAGQIRAQQMLSDAAALEVNGDVVKVINLTGHKLITGYPEGRRMWLNVRYFDALDALVDEVGGYGQITADIEGEPTQVETLLDPSDPELRIYEVHNAITQEWANDLIGLGVSSSLALTYDRQTGAVTNTLADLAAQAPGTQIETNHFVLNNFTASDTRIPAYGMPYDETATRNALPVPPTQYGNPGPGGTFEYWDEVQLNPPVAAVRADITLYYQPTSWEYIQFLALANDGSNAFLAEEGNRAQDAWLNTGMAAPHAMTTTTWAIAEVCGDGVPEGSEECDNGASNGTPGQCCSATCTFESAATECRASVGTCDVAELCSGAGATCPADGFAPASTECRAQADVCDVAELCSGSGPTCPTDGFEPAATVCRASAGICDVAEACTGAAAACPGDVFLPAATECRTAADVCDVAEACSGGSPLCPADGFEPVTTECRARADICDLAETCTGAGPACPADGFEPATAECRASADVCDVAELCTGTGIACPADGFEPASTECRASADICDLAELCTGTGAACPADALEPASTECRAVADLCDVAELCTGTGVACPADGFLPAATLCRAVAGACDVADTCTGSTPDCADVFVPAATECRSQTDVCDVAEACTGADPDCPADGFEPVTTVCRAQAGACDLADTCTGGDAACPADAYQPAGYMCRASQGLCDIEDLCSGGQPNCPNGFEPSTTQCRVQSGACDVADFCPGDASNCPNDLASAGTVCRPGSASCEGDEVCDGVTQTCPPLPNPPLDCDDGNACTADGCDLVTGCFNDPIPECLAEVPASPNWGLGMLALMLAMSGALIVQIRRHGRVA